MSANINPIFTLSANLGVGVPSGANTGRDGTGTLTTVLTAGNNGTMVERVTGLAQTTTTAGMVRLFTVDPSSNKYLYEELLTTAVTPSGTAVAATVQSSKITPSTPLVIPSGWALKGTINNASETWNIFAEGGDF